MTTTGITTWPTKRTAILVIHGVGQQNPFETLDDLGCGLVGALEGGNNTFELYHGLKEGVSAGKSWVTNYLSIVKDNKRNQAIDCYEYYWAHLTQRQITQQEVFDWIIKTGELARKYYDCDSALIEAYEKHPLPNTPFGSRYRVGGKLRFDKYWYLKQLGGWLWPARAFWWLVGVVSSFRLPFPNLALLSTFKQALQWVAKLLEGPMVDGLGDVTIYAASDMKSRNFEVRKKILDGATETLEWLMRNPQYEQVIVLGHSLGSVIAYDAVNRLNNRFNTNLVLRKSAGKLRGLVTFGSPLDKFAYFFRVRVEESKSIMRQILDQHIGFRCKEWNLEPCDKGPSGGKPQVVHSEVKDCLGHVMWVNFWHPKDPIAGRLDFYKISEDRAAFVAQRTANPQAPEAKGYNERMTEKAKWGAKAHDSYWNSQRMYQLIFEDILIS